MIIKCPECGKDVSSEAEACPFCGYPIKNPKKKNKQENAIHQTLWKDIVGVSVSGTAIIVLCPVLICFGITAHNILPILCGAIGIILLLPSFIICLTNLSKRKS